MEREPLAIRNGLKIYTRLQTKTPLKAHKPLRKVSKKQAEENMIWFQTKVKRIKALLNKFGFIKCEYCLKPIRETETRDAHHNDRNRNNNEYNNARIVHRDCHSIITDRNIRDIPSLLD